ncbi:MAG TPA: ABC transporter permease [Gemmatimonadaceae bacterium]|nr:ABC transporter permease [Gemmatimonadaceae bacterium]
MRTTRHALRALARAPGFAAIAILTLALGIGANSAIFSVIHGVVLKPLGYPEPERLVFITSQFPTLGFDQFWISPPEYVELRERSRSYSAIGAYVTNAVNLGEAETPLRVSSAAVTSQLFEALGVPARRGRALVPDDNLPGAEPVVVLSHELWERSYGANPDLVGSLIDVDGMRRTVAGVMPRGFDVHDQGVQIWLPLTIDPANPGGRGNHFLYLVARLAPGVSLAQARDEMETLLARWPEENPGTHAPSSPNHRLRIDDLQSDIVGAARRALWVLQGAVAFVLLIACANMANLLLARAESRHREFAIRTALGAGRGRLLGQFMTEGVLLSFAGGAVGLFLAWIGVKALLAASPDSIPRAAEVGLEWPVVGFTLALAVGTGIIFGLAPLLHLGERGMTMALKEGGRGSTAGAARHRVRRGLVVAEVALAVVLVIGAGLMLRSFWNLTQVDAGFDRSRLVTFGLVLPAATYPQGSERTAFFAQVLERLGAVPGVQGVASMTGLPPRRNVNANDTDIEDYTFVPGSGGPIENVDYYNYVTADYFGTMGIPAIEGRTFTAGDAGGLPVAVINETLAKRFWEDRSPVGRRLKPGFGDQVPWFTIVGVVRDVKQGGVESATGTELYLDYEQAPAVLSFAPRAMNVVVRTTLPVSAIGASIQRTVRDLDAALPIVDMRTMDEVFASTMVRPRFLAQLLGAFGLLALALAAVGTYGILSYAVAERRHEIGIRMALGAGRNAVMGMVLRQGLRVAVFGIVLGVAGALAVTRLASSLLFEVKATDPSTFVAVGIFITLVAAMASTIPARRATRVDPMVVLREE